jgi:hypothetical protein
MTADPRIALLRDHGADNEASRLVDRLDATAILIDSDASHSDLAVSIANLAARIWPNVRVTGQNGVIQLPVFGSGRRSEIAERLVRGIRTAPPTAPTTRLTLAVGDASADADVHVTADEWSMRFSGSRGSSLGGAPGPATSAAASLAVAELFRLSLPELPGVRLGSSTFEWNLVDYRLSLARDKPDLAEVEGTCFGVGSVGSSAVLALLIARVAGDVDVVDDDLLQPRNRLRYPMWIGPHHGSKVRWIADVAENGLLRVKPHHERAAQYIDQVNRHPRLAISAVDSAEARRDIADALACETLNAGVDGLQFHVSRHRFDDGFACVYCPYLDVAPPMSQTDVYAELTGLEAARTSQLLSGDRLTERDVRSMIAAGRLGTDDAGDLVGGRIDDVARARLYAAATVPGHRQLAVSAPFVSALAGAILAAEAIKTSRPDLTLDRRVDIDMSGWPTGFTSGPAQDSTGRCLCRDAFRQVPYREAWGATD